MATQLRSSLEASVGKASTREEYIRLTQMTMEADRIVRALEQKIKTDGED